ncbi:MAG: HAMP domain-containing protein [Elusimicrobiota bacterium]
MSSEKRRKLLIEPRFQVQLMLRMAAWAVLATLITGGCILFFLAMADQKAAGDFFFVVPEAGTHPVMFNRVQIVLPALAISLAVNLVLGVFFTLLYSQRLAGPLHRLTQDMLKVARGEPVKLGFHLRDSDELQEVAHAFDSLLKSLAEKGFLKR